MFSSADLSLADGKIIFYGLRCFIFINFLVERSLDPMATTHPDPISTYEAGQWIFWGHFISHTQTGFRWKVGVYIGGLQNFLSKLGKWAVYSLLQSQAFLTGLATGLRPLIFKKSSRTTSLGTFSLLKIIRNRL
jgi:hypothetical protein